MPSWGHGGAIGFSILGGRWGVRAPTLARGSTQDFRLWERSHQEQVCGRNQEGPSLELQSHKEEGAETEATRTPGVTPAFLGSCESWTAGVREGPGPCVKTELGLGPGFQGQ